MIYMRDNVSGDLFPMKKVDEVTWNGFIPRNAKFTISKILHIPVNQVALVGMPFVKERINITTRVSIDGRPVFGRQRYWEGVAKIESVELLHAYKDEEPIGAFAADGMKVMVDWESLYDVGMDMPCGIVLGIYEMGLP